MTTTYKVKDSNNHVIGYISNSDSIEQAMAMAIKAFEEFNDLEEDDEYEFPSFFQCCAFDTKSIGHFKRRSFDLGVCNN